MTVENDPSVLVLEDEMIVGMDIAMSLKDAGFAVQGPFKTIEKAMASIREKMPAFAVLDLNLGNGTTSEDVAAELSAEGRPFVFLTGYGASSHPVIRRFDHAECISKPVNVDVITNMIRSSMS